jgi:uncharacterized small protein (DUF1192 family)
MPDFREMTNTTRTGILISLLLCAAPYGCMKPPAKTAAPAPASKPAPPSSANADQFYDSGEYLDAAQAYELYLKENPEAGDRDRAMFRLALSYALAGGEPENFRKSQNLMRTVYTQFPESQYKKTIQVILSLQTDIDRLRVDLSEKSGQIKELSESLEIKDRTIAEKIQLAQDKDKVLLQKDRVIRDKEKIITDRDKALEELEDRILKLTQELERMKRIDLQRRPSRPPS